MHIVLGLGNPGEQYRNTRHNLGFRVVERLARRSGASMDQARRRDLGGRCWTLDATLGDRPVVLAKPQTFMNRSGIAAAALCRERGIEPDNLLVVYDDADLALGRIRLRPGGGAGGHNGIRSLIEFLGDGEFGRIKLGVRGAGRECRPLADYVLEDFDPEELPLVDRLIDLAADAVYAALADGIPDAMNRFNGRSVEDGSG